MSGCYWIGSNSGKALGGIIKEELGFMHNFGLGMLASVLTGIYAVVFLKDSTRIRQARLREEARLAGNTEDPDSKEKVEEMDCNTEDPENKEKVEEVDKPTTKEKLRQLFSLKNVKDGFK